MIASFVIEAPFRIETELNSMMRFALLALCIVAICEHYAETVYVPYSQLYDYVKDGRSVNGPFPSNLKNMPYACYQPPLKGSCDRMYVAWFFDIIRRQCMPFFYSGCGGNENRFSSKNSCYLHCEKSRRI